MAARKRPRKTSDASKHDPIATAIGRTRKRADTSRQVEEEDSFYNQHGESVIGTPYNLQSLARILEQSNALPQCVGAMVTNVAAVGFKVVPIKKDVKIKKAEQELLESFIESANPDESLTTVHSKVVNNYEKYGFGFYEIIRNRAGQPSIIRYCKSSVTRITKGNGARVPVKATIVRGGSRSTITEYKTFRRYVQKSGQNKVYFKEFGDSRKMSYKTGRYEGEAAEQGSSKKYKVPKGEDATELLHTRQMSEDAYGIPRWISQLPNILGSREAEEVNLRYFEDNTVPPMLLSVAGGRLTKASFLELKELLETRGVGAERQHQILLVEAVGEASDIDGKPSNVELKVDKLADARQSDGLFKEYDDANIGKVRSSFRLPPVVLGMSQDVTFATANVSAFLAETQVFLPERRTHDEFMNKRFVNHPLGLNLKTCKLESKGPMLTNPDQVVKALTATNVMGGVTPRSAVDIINETMQLTLPQYPEPNQEGWAEWMDKPISLGQREAMGSTQQTGEGDSTHDEEDTKDGNTKEIEEMFNRQYRGNVEEFTQP